MTDRPVDTTTPHPVATDAAASAPFAPTLDQWAQMMDILRSNKAADLETSATVHAVAMKKALRPENEVPPGVSAFNPLGERDHPRPKPSHLYLMGPYPICDPGDYNTVTRTELELLAQLRPGDYMVTKADGTDVKCTVKTEYTANGTTPMRTTLIIPMADDDQKANWPPLVQLLLQITTGEAPMASFSRMQAIIDRQAEELRALKAQQMAGSAA